MDEISRENEALHAQIQQLEQERDTLHKENEQLCMAKGGPSIIDLATQTYFRRTAGLQQEVENLKKKLADCAKENLNIKDKLSEANAMRSHLDQLHKLEFSKNAEVLKQVEHFRGIAAKAFSDFDHAVLEAEKAKENEELVRQNLNEVEMRLQELTVGSIETKEQVTQFQMKLEEQNQEIENCRKVIDKFYKIRLHASREGEDDEIRLHDQLENISYDDKYACLNDDPMESWSFNGHQKTFSANYVAALLEEIETLRHSVDNLQNKLKMGWETEKHLKSRVSIMERQKILSDTHIVDGISSLREYHNRQRIHIMELLDDERSFQQSVVSSIDKKIGKLHRVVQAAEVTSPSMPKFPQAADFSETLVQALQEKISALILSSQREERYVWEKNVHATIQETVDELQKYLKLASEQKVKALLELAEVKQQYQQLLEKTISESPQENLLSNSVERYGQRKSLWKTASLKRWLGTQEKSPGVVYHNLTAEGFLNDQRLKLSRDNARLQIENATLKDRIHSLERLTSDISKLRLSLIQAKMTRLSKGTSTSTPKQLDETIKEAESLKIALTSALPLSWAVEEDASSSRYIMVGENPKQEYEKIDTVSAAGLEMVELLVMAAQIMKERKSKREVKLT